MNSSKFEYGAVLAQAVQVTDDALIVQLTDGRTISAPLVWYPRLVHGTESERNKWEFNGGGTGIHWPHLDEDISVEGLLLGRPSGESQKSLQRWLDQRNATVANT
jgi:Protein of unknown function (DUF2442)